eukprot:1854969-Pyramimonas_sp.AAC.1
MKERPANSSPWRHWGPTQPRPARGTSWCRRTPPRCLEPHETAAGPFRDLADAPGRGPVLRAGCSTNQRRA